MSQLSKGSGPDLWIGGKGFYSNKLIQLYFRFGSVNVFSSCKTVNSGGSGYQVPTGKKLIIKALYAFIQAQAGAPNGLSKLGYGDTDINFNSASAPTNPVYAFSESSGQLTVAVPASSQPNDINQCQTFIGDFEVPEGKFPFVSGYSCAGMVFAELVDA